jgi:hypothetical protein
MKRPIQKMTQWASRLYPRAWRERYGDEFGALLEDSQPRLRDAWDIAKEALTMQLRRTAAFAGVGAILGALVGGIVSRHHDRYIASAVMAVSVQGIDSAAANSQAVQSLVKASWTRDALLEIITSLKLYTPDRPADELIRRMRENIKVALFDKTAHSFTVDFVGENPDQAQEVRRALVAHLIDDNIRIGASPPATIQLVDYPPVSHSVPRPATVIAFWTAVGAGVGLALAWLRRRANPQTA